MDKYSKEILTLLKDAFIRVAGNKPFQNTSEAREFYLENLADNLYFPMSASANADYGNGSGNEIDSGKMNALRSSSALTYNLFWNQEAEIVAGQGTGLGTGVYQVEFEKQYHTLKPSASNHPANLDAFLYCSDTQEAIACEMKMTEWLFNKPGMLRAAYLAQNKYIDTEAGRVFSKVAESLILHNDYEDPWIPKSEYPGVASRYDAFQMFKHAVACYTACVAEDPRPIKKLTLVNCAWTLPSPEVLTPELRDRYRREEGTELAEFAQFKEAMEPVKVLFADKGIQFNIQFFKFSEFLSLFRKTPAELEYLRRYTLDRESRGVACPTDKSASFST